MAWPKLKNIMLIILLAANAFLLTLVLGAGFQSRQYNNSVLTDALAILDQNGIALDPRILPKEPLPAAQTLTSDAATRLSVASALLGERTAIQSQSSVLTQYSGSGGILEFRSGNDFSAIFAEGAHPIALDSPEHHALKLADSLGLEVSVVPTTVSVPDGATAVTLRQCVDGYPIFSHELTARYKNGSLSGLEGRALFGTPAPDTQAVSLNLATLLVRFRAGIAESGAVCRAIVAITPGYALSSASGDALVLTPTLQMETDTGTLYSLNALTGAFVTMQ